MTDDPYAWPREAFALKESPLMRDAMLGRLLMAQWEHRRAGAELAARAPGSPWWRHAADAQRRAFRDMVAARAGLAQRAFEAQPA